MLTSTNSASFVIVKKDITYAKNKWITEKFGDLIEQTESVSEDIVYQVEEDDCVIPPIDIERIVKNLLCSALLLKVFRSYQGNHQHFLII